MRAFFFPQISAMVNRASSIEYELSPAVRTSPRYRCSPVVPVVEGCVKIREELVRVPAFHVTLTGQVVDAVGAQELAMVALRDPRQALPHRALERQNIEFVVRNIRQHPLDKIGWRDALFE